MDVSSKKYSRTYIQLFSRLLKQAYLKGKIHGLLQGEPPRPQTQNKYLEQDHGQLSEFQACILYIENHPGKKGMVTLSGIEKRQPYFFASICLSWLDFDIFVNF